MKFSLVVPPATLKTSRDMAGGFGMDTGGSFCLPPRDLAVGGAILRKSGHEVLLIDATAEGLSQAECLERDEAFGSGVVIGMVSLNTLWRDMTTLSLLGRNKPAYAATLWPHPTEMEGLSTFPNIKGLFLLRDPQSWKGFAASGEPQAVGAPVAMEEAAADWSLVQPDRYRYPLLPGNVAAVRASYGCPYPCGYYCPYPLAEGNRWMPRPIENVVKEIGGALERGFDSVLFRDAVLTLDRARTKSLCEQLAGWFPGLAWWAETRVDCLSDEVLGWLARAGCRGLNVGIESGDDALRYSLAKPGLRAERIEQTLRAARRHGMKLHFLILVGLPGETRETLARTIQRLAEWRPDSIGYCLATPFPGTAFARDALAAGWVVDFNWEHYGSDRITVCPDTLQPSDLREATEFLRRLIGAATSKAAKRVAEEAAAWARAPQPTLTPEESLSVILPTRDRPERLDVCLEHLAAQVGAQEFTIVVADDSEQATAEAVVSRWQERLPGRLRYVKVGGKGPATARNRAIAAAGTTLLLLLGDDIYADPHLVARHVQAHRRHPGEEEAIVGWIGHAPKAGMSPFVYWIENDGPQFHFNRLTPWKEVPGFNYFCSSNLSLKRNMLLRVGGFSECFPKAVAEDIELSFRLFQQGMKLFYEPSAAGWHHHPDLAMVKYVEQRQFDAGYEIARLVAMRPEALNAIVPFSAFAMNPFILLPGETGPAVSREVIAAPWKYVSSRFWPDIFEVYACLSQYSFLRGFAEGTARHSGASPDPANALATACRMLQGCGVKSMPRADAPDASAARPRGIGGTPRRAAGFVLGKCRSLLRRIASDQ